MINKILTKEFLNKEYNIKQKSSLQLSKELNISSSAILRAFSSIVISIFHQYYQIFL